MQKKLRRLAVVAVGEEKDKHSFDRSQPMVAIIQVSVGFAAQFYSTYCRQAPQLDKPSIRTNSEVMVLMMMPYFAHAVW